MTDIQDEFAKGHKAYKRGGGILWNVFHNEKTKLSGEDALLIFNTYGIAPRELILLAASHGYDIDEVEFEKLLNEQRESSKRMIQCAS